MQLFSKIGLLIIVMYGFFFTFIAFFHKIQYRILFKNFRAIMVVTGVLFLLWVFYFEPKAFIRWDLIEHYKTIELMRGKDIGYALNYGVYKNLPVINLYFFFISRFSTNNLLPVIPVAIDLCIFGYIFCDVIKREAAENNYISMRTAMLTFLTWLSTIGVKLMISGIRTTLALSLCTLAIYWEKINGKNKMKALLLYLLALGIHNYAFLFIIIRLLCNLKTKKMILPVCAVCAVVGPELLKLILDILPNGYLYESSQRALYFWDQMFFLNAFKRFDKATLTVYMGLIFISFVAYRFTRRLKNCELSNDYERSIIDYSETITSVSLGLSFNYLFLERITYGLAYVFVLLIPMYYKNRETLTIQGVGAALVFLWVFFFNDIYIFIVNWIEVYFLAF